ncbi:hypothetical protein AWM68_17765 [Fictibacillus phosphorivorans]|uniref:Uncharacterized protein n=1 Tax=Fictibacillus phosphorivorans TaxID=1221500 RepID=A0A163S2P2_9BACL|nr:hypothetical protein [Fictibacillus phosphorivorans]KZE68017.1 hypothetical protein AWM68_17765 [Fictibacillus phosphorivorans]
MKIDFQKLSNKLKEREQSKLADESGMANVIYYIWNHHSIKNIDFNSFSLEDAKLAFEEFYFIPTFEEEPTTAELEELKSNKWSILTNTENMIYALVKSDKKIYLNDDDFI